MADTTVEVWNMVLAYLNAGTVSSTTENSRQARALSVFADDTRQEMLRDLAPPFAHKVATLSESSDTNYTEYSYIYDLPSDYLKIVDLLDSSYYKYDTYYYIDDSHIYLNYTPGIIRYIYDCSDVTLWDNDFTEAYVLYMAAKVAPQLIPGGLKYQQQYLALYERKKIDAMGKAGEEEFNHDYTPQEYNDWW